jgi:hypothetical protein
MKKMRTVPERMGLAGLILLAVGIFVSGCRGTGSGPAGTEAANEVQLLSGGICQTEGSGSVLGPEVRESSSILRSRRHPGIYWTHNDSGGTPELFALDRSGRVVGRMTVPGVGNRDWEELAYGPCGNPGEGMDQPLPGRHACLWIGEFGDNNQVRDTVYLFRVPEPALTERETSTPEVFPFRYSNGPRDSEALFFDAFDRPWIVTKGRPIEASSAGGTDRGNGRITAYRLPVSMRPGEVSVAEPVQTFGSMPPSQELRVTAGASSPSASRFVLRTYVGLQFYNLEADTLRALLPGDGVDLRPLQEPQGEGVDLDDAGGVVLSSERVDEVPGTLHLLHCRPD